MMPVSANDNLDAELRGALAYVENGGLAEVRLIAEASKDAGHKKVLSDTAMAIALCRLASEGIEARTKPADAPPETKAWLHTPTGNVFSVADFERLQAKWQRQFASTHTAAEIASDFVALGFCWHLPQRDRSTKMRPQTIPRVVNSSDWISRTRTARDLLVAAHGYRAGDFVTVDDALRNDGISLDWCSVYPRSWREAFCGRRLNWIAEHAFPVGLTLFWPEGTDYWGEGYDAQDPIFILSDLNFWASLTDDDIRAMLA